MEKNLKSNQNILVTSTEIHNMLINILSHNKNYHNSLIGKLDYKNSCKKYKIIGGCFCN